MNNNQNRFLSGEGLKYCSVHRHSYARAFCLRVHICNYPWGTSRTLDFVQVRFRLISSLVYLPHHFFSQTASQENIKSLYWTLMAKQDNYMKGSSCFICTLRMWGQNVNRIGLFRCLLSLFVSALPVSARHEQMKLSNQQFFYVIDLQSCELWKKKTF